MLESLPVDSDFDLDAMRLTHNERKKDLPAHGHRRYEDGLKSVKGR